MIKTNKLVEQVLQESGSDPHEREHEAQQKKFKSLQKLRTDAQIDVYDKLKKYYQVEFLDSNKLAANALSQLELMQEDHELVLKVFNDKITKQLEAKQANLPPYWPQLIQTQVEAFAPELQNFVRSQQKTKLDKSILEKRQELIVCLQKAYDEIFKNYNKTETSAKFLSQVKDLQTQNEELGKYNRLIVSIQASVFHTMLRFGARILEKIKVFAKGNEHVRSFCVHSEKKEQNVYHNFVHYAFQPITKYGMTIHKQDLACLTQNGPVSDKTIDFLLHFLHERSVQVASSDTFVISPNFQLSKPFEEQKLQTLKHLTSNCIFQKFKHVVFFLRLAPGHECIARVVNSPTQQIQILDCAQFYQTPQQQQACLELILSQIKNFLFQELVDKSGMTNQECSDVCDKYEHSVIAQPFMQYNQQMQVFHTFKQFADNHHMDIVHLTHEQIQQFKFQIFKMFLKLEKLPLDHSPFEILF